MSPNYVKNGRYTNDTARIDGKVVIITGSNTGLGKANALELAKRGGKIYMACRSEERGNAAVDEVKSASGSSTVYFMSLDLASFASIREFSKKFHVIQKRLDILINNAGVLSPLGRTEEGFELNMGTNHLGHFLLTNLLLDLLKAAAPSRIIVLSSVTHRIGTIDKENLTGEKFFAGMFKSYGNSKLANILFTKELSQMLEGSEVTVNCLCPGIVSTEVTRHFNPIIRFFSVPFQNYIQRSPKEGAHTQNMLAVEPELEKTSGKYFVNCLEREPSIKAEDYALMKWLWVESVKLTGLDDHAAKSQKSQQETSPLTIRFLHKL